jgi:hypothetical protein
MVAFQLYLKSGKQRKVGWVGDDSHVVFGQKFHGEKEVETVHCHDARASFFVSKVRGKVFAHFHTVTAKRHSSMQN